MNPELISTVALWFGYAALFGIAILFLVGLYYGVYKAINVILERIFLPIWGYHVVKACVAIGCTKSREKGLYIRYLFQILEDHERKYPELRGLMLEYAKEVVEADKLRKECEAACAGSEGRDL